MHEISFYLICYFLKVVVRLVPMMWLAAMAYISSPRPRITIIWVPVHTKPALGPVEPYVIHLFYVLGALIFVARYPS